MNRDPEANTFRLLAWLLDLNSDDFIPHSTFVSDEIANASLPSAGQRSSPGNSNSGQPTSTDTGAVEDLLLDEVDPLDSEEFDGFIPDRNYTQEGERLGEQPLEMGEIPAVQDRFQAVLKRRLQTTIESNPPLFPWETEVCEYYDDFSDASASQLVPARAWATQLQNLTLPVPVQIPESILAELLEQCQQVAQSRLQEGAKLVRAVEVLFQNQFQTVNQLAEMVLLGYRFNPQLGLLESTHRGAVDRVNFPSSYEVATPIQQMLLSLLAARQLIRDLTLTLSPTRPVTQRQWQTAFGLLTLQANYQMIEGRSRLQIQGELPCGGSLKFRGRDAEANAQCAAPGFLTVELSDLIPNETYSLEVQLQTEDRMPLVFTVCPTS